MSKYLCLAGILLFSTGLYPEKITKTKILKNHFQDFSESYEDAYQEKYGSFWLERISKFTESYISCGDYSKGIARIQCTNPD